MAYADTAKSRHAIRLLAKTGVISDIEDIIWACASDAFCCHYYDYDVEIYEKCGKHHFLHDRFPVGAQSNGLFSEDEAAECVKHFENGVMATVFYEFYSDKSLILRFHLRDKYIHGEIGEFELITVLKFEDIRYCEDYQVDAYTHPIFSLEESVSKTLLWYDLND